MVESPEVE